jgi:hypothetical protein
VTARLTTWVAVAAAALALSLLTRSVAARRRAAPPMAARAERPPRPGPPRLAIGGPGAEAVAARGDPPDPWSTLEARFNAEGSDASSVQTVREIAAVLADLKLRGTALSSARCGRSLCLVLLDHADEEAQREAPLFLTRGPFAQGVHYRYQGLRTEAILQRP